jgi:hypothetical protein
VSEGPLYEAFTRDAELWTRIEVTGDPDDPKRSPRVSRAWAIEQISKYGADNPWVLVNVFGRFPPKGIDHLLGAEDVARAIGREYGEADYIDEPKVLGVDVARFGDDRSCILMRQGPVCFRPRILRNLSTMELAAQVALVIEEQHPDQVFVDVGGIGGGVVDRLHQLEYKRLVIGVDFGSGQLKLSTMECLNRRSEMWYLMSEWVLERGAMPDIAELRAELPAPTHHFDARQKLVLESKADMKKRGIPSPDVADALALTFAAPVASRAVRDFQARGTTRCKTEYDSHSR